MKAVVYGVYSILLIIIIAIATILYMNNKWQLTVLVKDFMNHNIEGKMDFDSLRFNFDKLPVIGVELKNGILIGETEFFPNDTLCTVNNLKVDINPFKIFQENLIDIRYVYTEGAKVKVLLNKEGKQNWAIWRFKKQSETEVPDTLKKKNKPIELNIRETIIKNKPYFFYNNKRNGNTMTATAEQAYLLGRIAIDYTRLDADSMLFLGVNYDMNFRQTGLKIKTKNSDIYVLKRDSAQWKNIYADISGHLNQVKIKNKSYLIDSNMSLLGNVSIDKDYKEFVFNKFRFEIDNDVLGVTGLIKPKDRKSVV